MMSDSLRTHFSRCGLVATVCALSTTVLAAPVTWNFDVSTTGQNVFWTSPTAVDITAPEYDVVYTVEHVYASIRYLFITTTVEVTDQIPPIYLSNSQTLAGPPPIVFPTQTFVFPSPPEPLAVAATIDLSIDAIGHGHLDLTNIQLGTYPLNLPPFGTVTVTITGIRSVGNVRVTPVFEGDVDRDGDVDLNDLAALLAAFGHCFDSPSYNADADLDLDGCITLSDLSLLLANYGRT
jgi:hypothetical protein